MKANSIRQKLSILLALILLMSITPMTGASAATVTYRGMQTRLARKGYLSSSYITGSKNSATTHAVRVFEMVNGLKADGVADVKTVKKIFSASARKRPSINNAAWASSGIARNLPRKRTAKIIDIRTGTVIRIRRVGGVNHLDVEPLTRTDTAKLKKVYGGTWSWDSRPILLIANGHFYAAAMNGMPHGKQLSKANGFNGQFCIHLKGCKTHGTNRVNAAHQASIRYAYSYMTA
ncbi:MAG: peptidoglycan-binding protein [Clostridia bacterium]|nr:peptidoglycan-binding protein [Clostridia bacterium]